MSIRVSALRLAKSSVGGGFVFFLFFSSSALRAVPAHDHRATMQSTLDVLVLRIPPRRSWCHAPIRWRVEHCERSDGGQWAHRPAPIRFARCGCINPPVSALVPITCACPVVRSSMSLALPEAAAAHAQRPPAPAKFKLTHCKSTAVTSDTVCCCSRTAVQLTCKCLHASMTAVRSSSSSIDRSTARAIVTAQSRSVLRPVAGWGCVCTAADPADRE